MGGHVVRMYRAYRIEDGRIVTPALIFETHDDAVAITWARACLDDENIEIWQGERRVAAPTVDNE
jgi:hypothetical protein